MIEISEREYWKKMNYDDAELYCSMIVIDGKNDWRMITQLEYINIDVEWKKYLNELEIALWYYGDGDSYLGGRYWVVPVRDV
jgi:hypothetical protein